MRRAKRLSEDQLMQAGWALTGMVLLAGAVLAAELARRHMALLGSICGDAAPHCAWCFATAGFALAGVAALGVAIRRPAAVRA